MHLSEALIAPFDTVACHVHWDGTGADWEDLATHDEGARLSWVRAVRVAYGKLVAITEANVNHTDEAILASGNASQPAQIIQWLVSLRTDVDSVGYDTEFWHDVAQTPEQGAQILAAITRSRHRCLHTLAGTSYRAHDGSAGDLRILQSPHDTVDCASFPRLLFLTGCDKDDGDYVAALAATATLMPFALLLEMVAFYSVKFNFLWQMHRSSSTRYTVSICWGHCSSRSSSGCCSRGGIANTQAPRHRPNPNEYQNLRGQMHGLVRHYCAGLLETPCGDTKHPRKRRKTE